jgi:hypothetical protein
MDYSATASIYNQKQLARILKEVQDQDPGSFPEHLKKFV